VPKFGKNAVAITVVAITWSFFFKCQYSLMRAALKKVTKMFFFLDKLLMNFTAEKALS
jgi:hypothetical protein